MIGAAGAVLSRCSVRQVLRSAAGHQSGFRAGKIVPASNKAHCQQQINASVNDRGMGRKLVSREEQPVDIKISPPASSRSPLLRRSAPASIGSNRSEFAPLPFIRINQPRLTPPAVSAPPAARRGRLQRRHRQSGRSPRAAAALSAIILSPAADPEPAPAPAPASSGRACRAAGPAPASGNAPLSLSPDAAPACSSARLLVPAHHPQRALRR